MTDQEYALWLAANRACAYGIAKSPCDDCPLDFALEQRNAGAVRPSECRPRGVEDDEPPPPAEGRPIKSRRGSHAYVRPAERLRHRRARGRLNQRAYVYRHPDRKADTDARYRASHLEEWEDRRSRWWDAHKDEINRRRREERARQREAVAA